MPSSKTCLLNYPLELPPRKGFIEQNYIPLKLCFMRRLPHRYIEAVVGLSGYMAGLRFSYAHKLVLPWLGEKIINSCFRSNDNLM